MLFWGNSDAATVEEELLLPQSSELELDPPKARCSRWQETP